MNWGLLSKYRNELYGLSIIWIMLFHGLELKKASLPKFLGFLQPVLYHGNCGVEIFLFLSGICLYFSLKGNKDLKTFFQKRIKRILLPFLLIDGCYWFYICIYLQRDTIMFFKNITFYSFWISGVQTVWFIALILLLYLVYPFIYKVVDREKNSFTIISLLIIMFYILCFALKMYFPMWFSKVEIALTRIPVFLVGCCVGKLVYYESSINTTTRIVTFIFAIYGLSYFYQQPYSLVKYLRLPYFFIGPSIALWMCVVLEYIKSTNINRLFCVWGEISLELYLMHIILRRIFTSTSLYSNRIYLNYTMYFIICFCLCFLICKLVYWLENKIWLYLGKVVIHER